MASCSFERVVQKILLASKVETFTVVEYIFLFLGVITLILIINYWMMRQSLRAIEEQLKLTREVLQLEIHAIRDVMEEAAKTRTER